MVMWTAAETIVTAGIWRRVLRRAGEMFVAKRRGWHISGQQQVSWGKGKRGHDDEQ